MTPNEKCNDVLKLIANKTSVSGNMYIPYVTLGGDVQYIMKEKYRLGNSSYNPTVADFIVLTGEYQGTFCPVNRSQSCACPEYGSCTEKQMYVSTYSTDYLVYRCTCPDGMDLSVKSTKCDNGMYNYFRCQCETCTGCASGASTCPCRVNQQCGCCPWVVDQYNQPVIDENGNKVRMFYVGNGWCSRCIISDDGVYVDALYGRADASSNPINANGPIDCCPPWAQIQYKASDTYSAN